MAEIDVGTEQAVHDGRAGFRRLIKNSTANILSGVSSGALALAVPPVLSRYLSVDSFAAWALILQIASYASLLNFGVQGAVGRFVAFALEKGDSRLADRIASTAMVTLLVAALAGFVVIGIAAYFLPIFFPKIPLELAQSGQIALCLIGFTLAIGLPFSIFNGIFTGLQRNEIPAAIIGGSRLVLAGALIGACMIYRSLIPMAIAFAAVNIVSYALQWLSHRYFAAHIHIRRDAVDRDAFREISSYSSSFMIWTISMFMVNGLDSTLVGKFQFEAVAVFASCVSITTFFSGLQQAVFSPLLQVASQLEAQDKRRELGLLLVRSTRLCTWMLLTLGSFVLLFAPQLLEIWLGKSFAQSGAPILSLLVIGNCIRLVAVPYSLLLLATNQHKLTRMGPVLEGVSNLLSAIILGHLFGAIGVAIGLIIGALVGQLFNYLMNLDASQKYIEIDKNYLIINSIGKIARFFIPVIIIILIELTSSIHINNWIKVIVLAALATGAMFYQLDSSQSRLGSSIFEKFFGFHNDK